MTTEQPWKTSNHGNRVNVEIQQICNRVTMEIQQPWQQGNHRNTTKLGKQRVTQSQLLYISYYSRPLHVMGCHHIKRYSKVEH
jgi:hypothetical protein